MLRLRLDETALMLGDDHCIRLLASSNNSLLGYGAAATSFGQHRLNPQAYEILHATCRLFGEMQRGVDEGGVNIEKLDSSAFLGYADRMGLHGGMIVQFFEAMPVDAGLRGLAFATYVFGAKHRGNDQHAVAAFLSDDCEGRKRRLSTCVRELGTALHHDAHEALLPELLVPSPPPTVPALRQEKGAPPSPSP